MAPPRRPAQGLGNGRTASDLLSPAAKTGASTYSRLAGQALRRFAATASCNQATQACIEVPGVKICATPWSYNG